MGVRSQRYVILGVLDLKMLENHWFRRMFCKTFIESGENTWRLAHIFHDFSKIADLQAHIAAPSAALRACRSTILEKSWKMCASLQVFWPDSMNVLQILLPNQWHYFDCRPPSKKCCSRDAKIQIFESTKDYIFKQMFQKDFFFLFQK